MPYTTYLENALLNHVHGIAIYTPPGTIYLGLCTGVTSGGVITGEPVGNNYGRVTIANNNNSWNPAALGVMANNAAFQFAQANGSWGTLTMWFTIDGSGNVLEYGNLSGSLPISANDQPLVGAGQLNLTLQ